MLCRTIFLAIAACAVAADAAVVPISPMGGETVTLLPEGQRDVIAQPTYKCRVERLKEKRIGKNDAEDQWGMSRPLVLRWRVTDGEQGPWKIEIGKKDDMSDARVWLVADKKPHLPGEKDVFGLKLTDANLEVGQTYHWRIWSDVKCTRSVSCGSTLSAPCKCGHGKVACASSVATFTTDGQPPRWIALEGRVKNVRDIGGWRTHDGRRVKQGMAFRGEGLNDDSVDGETAGRNRLTAEDVNYLKDTLKIRTDLDLRTPSEVAGMAKSPIGDGVRFVHHPSPAYAGLFSKDGKGSNLADEGKKTMAANFRVFCDKKNYPIFFHCIGGTDRTGSLAYVLNAVLGVDRHDLEVDWESTLYPDRIPELKPYYSGKRGWRSNEYFDEGFAKYGYANTSWNDRVVLYLLDCGITKEEIEQFRSIMLEPQSHAIRSERSLWNDFVTPPDAARPWCYWWWINGHADRETITADLEAMKRLGFGGVLMFDSRGYFDDDDHVVNPKAEIVWGSNEWQELVAFSVRECARLGLEFTMNASASGGKLNGFVEDREYETDIMNREAVVAHLDRAMGPILKRVPDLVGKTFTHIYSPSYEGNVKTGGSWKTIKDTFYATMREWAHAQGLKLYSESGGPWGWGSKSTPLDCDQLDLLAHNDFPQGEFWPTCGRGATQHAGHANRYGHFFQRAIVLSARREGRRIASMEAFTHMYHHWSVDPAFLKPLADIAFADGANRLVWHTFTCSPKKFGIPGAEYFAG